MHNDSCPERHASESDRSQCSNALSKEHGYRRVCFQDQDSNFRDRLDVGTMVRRGVLSVTDNLSYDRRQLGNDIPQTFEVHCPALQSRLKLNIPQYDMFDREGYKVFTKDYVVSLCQKALGGSPAWDYNIKEPMRRGARLQLCWRKGTMLDWIRWEEDANNMKRGWAVLYGLSLGKVSSYCLTKEPPWKPTVI